MKILSAFVLAIVLIGGTARLQASGPPVGPTGVAYLDDSLGDLFVGNPVTGSFSLVGTSSTAAGFGGFTDIGFAAGVLYGISPNGTLYTINTLSAQITQDGSTGATGVTNGSLVGLSDSTSNILIGGGNGNIYNINPSNGVGTVIGTGSVNYTTAGDDTFGPGGVLYLTSTIANADTLFTINTTTGVGTSVGQLCNSSCSSAPWSNVFGMIYDTLNSTMYGFDVDGDEFDVNLSTPGSSGTVLALSGVTPTEEGDLLGAAFIATPEPSTFVLIGSALILLAAGLRRKANQTV